MNTGTDRDRCFIDFKQNIAGIALPEKFTFPFYYDPHPLSVIAAKELQEFLENRASEYGWEFWGEETEGGRGRMFGVLVVQKNDGSLGYLAAFSGNTNIADKGFPFVPSIFDFWDEDDFYRKGERESAIITEKIEALENDTEFIRLQETYRLSSAAAALEIETLNLEVKAAKKARDLKRKEAEQSLSPEAFSLLTEELNRESVYMNYRYKRTKKEWEATLDELSAAIKNIQDRIEELRAARKALSNSLHEEIYKGFQFLNQAGQHKGLDELFENTVLKFPPSGAGECAAPRLLQFAFKHQLKPVTMAEFWWGSTSKSDIRVHKYYYPACHGKCRPILSHMLEGIEMEENPMLNSQALDKVIETIYEDEDLLVIFKPEGLLSVPGRLVLDSVQTRIQLLYPKASSPMVVHRLDMDTSGLMLIAKNKEIYKLLQAQFIRRKVKKRYTALLEGTVKEDSGKIELPLTLDFLDRPRQMVSFEEGKNALTHYSVIERNNNRTLINFFPHTGRTHQLRVHAAHHLGLNCPIVGDDLYGTKEKRLYLHAAEIAFEHPATKEWLVFVKEAGW